MSSAIEPEGTGPELTAGPDETVSTQRELVASIQPPIAEQQARPAAEVALVTPSLADQYEERLWQIWEATHGGDSPRVAGGPDTDAWNLVREAVAGIGNLALIGAAIIEQHRRQAASLAGGAADGGLAGDPNTVQFLVGTVLEQLSPEQVPAFVSGPLVATIARLEREVGLSPEVTRERIVDIVLRALEMLRGTERVARLVPALLGYLGGEQRPETVGLYTTVTVLGQLLIGLNDRQSRMERLFVYHYALAGVCRLLVQDESLVLDLQFRQVIAVAAGNASTNLWQLLPDRASGARGTGEVIALRTILTTAVRDLTVTEDQAAAVLDALGLEHPQARAALTVISEAGALADIWSADAADVARFESAAAIAVMASGSTPDQVAARMYNAAVSLLGAPAPQAAAPLHARMLLCLLGLRLSLLLSTDVLDALDRLEGLDCAFGFLRAVAEYQDEEHEQAQIWPVIAGFAIALSELPRRLPRDRTDLAAGAARLNDAASRIRKPGSAVQADIGTRDDFLAATIRTIDALWPTAPSDRASDSETAMLDTAAVLRAVFEEILGRPQWGLRDLLDELVELRASPREEFITRYQPFTEPPGSRTGTGPPVAAGIASPQSWETLESELLRDPGSIVPALLHEFPRQPLTGASAQPDEKSR